MPECLKLMKLVKGLKWGCKRSKCVRWFTWTESLTAYSLCRRVSVVQYTDVIREAGTDKLERHTAKSVGYSINFTSGYQIFLSVYVREASMPVEVPPYLTIFVSIRFLLQPFPHLQQDISRLRVLRVRLLPSPCRADSLCRHKDNENVLRFRISYWYFCLTINVSSYRQIIVSSYIQKQTISVSINVHSSHSFKINLKVSTLSLSLVTLLSKLAG